MFFFLCLLFIDSMQLHELKPIHKPKKEKRVGRGGKKGTYSGRGIKGQKARAGRKLKPAIREMIKRYPKLRGYKFKSKKKNQAIVNVGTFEKKFRESDLVSPQVLLEKRLIRKIKGRMPKVKILGKGKLTKSLTVESCEVSKEAKEKIEKAHGIVK